MRKLILIFLFPVLAFGYVQQIDTLATYWLKIWGPHGGKLRDTSLSGARIKFDVNGFPHRDTIFTVPHSDTSDSSKDSRLNGGHTWDTTIHAQTAVTAITTPYSDSTGKVPKNYTAGIWAFDSLFSTLGYNTTGNYYKNGEPLVPDSSHASVYANHARDTIVDTGDVSTSGTNNPRAVEVIGIRNKGIPAMPLYGTSGYPRIYDFTWDGSTNQFVWNYHLNWSASLASIGALRIKNGSLIVGKNGQFTPIISNWDTLLANSSALHNKFLVSPLTTGWPANAEWDTIKNSDILFKVDSSHKTDTALDAGLWAGIPFPSPATGSLHQIGGVYTWLDSIGNCFKADTSIKSQHAIQANKADTVTSHIEWNMLSHLPDHYDSCTGSKYLGGYLWSSYLRSIAGLTADSTAKVPRNYTVNWWTFDSLYSRAAGIPFIDNNYITFGQNYYDGPWGRIAAQDARLEIYSLSNDLYLSGIAGVTLNGGGYRTKIDDSVTVPLVLSDTGKFWDGLWAKKCSTSILIDDSGALRAAHFSGIPHKATSSDSICVLWDGRLAMRTKAEILSDLGAAPLSAPSFTGIVGMSNTLKLGASPQLTGSTDALQVSSGNANALDLYRQVNGAGQAASGVAFYAQNDSGNPAQYGGIQGYIDAPNAGVMDGGVTINVKIAGTETNIWRFTKAGFIAVTDNSYDIGANGATRPRTGYFGTSISAPLATLTSRINIYRAVGLTDLQTYTSGVDSSIICVYQAQNFPTTNAYYRVMDIVAGGENSHSIIRLLVQANNTVPIEAMRLREDSVVVEVPNLVTQNIFASTGTISLHEATPLAGYGLDANVKSNFRDTTKGTVSYFVKDSAGTVICNGNLDFPVIGGGVRIKTGTNSRIGQATLVGGTIAVANTSVTANTRVFLTCATAIGTQGFLSYTQINGTSFTINSSAGAADNSVINWILVESIP